MNPKIKVLIVDDETRFRETTSTILKKKGFETAIAGSGEEALEIIRKTPHDVIVLDVKMGGGMDGHETLARIKEISPDTQVIMLTGHGNHDSASNSHKLAAFDYLVKPCDSEILTVKIKEAYSLRKKATNRIEKKVKDIMARVDDYSFVTVETTVREAVLKLEKALIQRTDGNQFREGGHLSLIVFDTQKKFAGIFRMKDLIRWIRPYYLYHSESTMLESIRYSRIFSSGWDGLFTIQMQRLADIRLGDLDLESPPMIDENANLMELSEQLYQTRRTRLVVTSGEKVVGIIREQDLFFEIVNIISHV